MNWNNLELPDNPYYQDDAVIIYNADCREILPLIPDKSIDLVLTDPPYGINRKDIVGDGDDVSFTILNEIDKYMEDDSYLVSFVPIGRLPEVLNIRNLTYRWLFFVWYSNTTRISHCPIGYSKVSLAAVYSKGKPKINNRINDWFKYIHRQKTQYYHPALKPDSPNEQLVTALSLRGGLVLDPFMGTGSSIFAAKKLNRKCIGIEIEERYCSIAAQRCCQTVMNFDTLKERRR